MQQSITQWIGLGLLCLLLIGCGGEPERQAENTPAQPEQAAESKVLAMVLETSKPTYWRDGEEAKTIDDVRAMVLAQPSTPDQGYTVTIDETHEREGQLRVLFSKTAGTDIEVDLAAESDANFDQIKEAFDLRAKAAALQEEAHLKGQVKEYSAQVSRLQGELRNLQSINRGFASTDETRLEFRKLNRQIDVTLAELIATEKAVEQAERRNNRERFVTLLRLR